MLLVQKPVLVASCLLLALPPLFLLPVKATKIFFRESYPHLRSRTVFACQSGYRARGWVRMKFAPCAGPWTGSAYHLKYNMHTPGVHAPRGSNANLGQFGMVKTGKD